MIEKQLVYNAIGVPSQMNLKPTHPWINFYGMNFSRPVGTFVFGGYVANVKFGPVPIVFVMKSKDIYESYKEFFLDLWKKAKQ